VKATRSILGLSAAHFVTDIYTPVLPAILPLLIAVHGYPYFWAGFIVTVYQLSSSLLQPVVGWLYDKRGFTPHIGKTVVLCAVFVSVIGILDSYPLILACAALGAMGHAFFHPSALGTVSKLAEGTSRGRLTSYFVVGGNLGFAAGPIAAGIVVGLFGLSGVTLLVIPGLIMSVVLHRVLPSPKPMVHGKTETVPGEESAASRTGVTLVIIASALRSCVIFGSIAYLPTYLVAARGFDVISANFLVSGMLLAGVVGQVAGGAASDKIGRKEYTLAALIASVVPFMIFLNTVGIVSYCALIAFGFLLWSTFSVTVAMSHELMPGNVGLVSGLMLGLAVGAGGLGVAVIGYIADLSGLLTALSALLLAIAGAVVIYALVPYPWRSLTRLRQQRT
jgi:FSR family fosmidomycin resistance protein-like MFS transporter